MNIPDDCRARPWKRGEIRTSQLRKILHKLTIDHALTNSNCSAIHEPKTCNEQQSAGQSSSTPACFHQLLQPQRSRTGTERSAAELHAEGTTSTWLGIGQTGALFGLHAKWQPQVIHLSIQQALVRITRMESAPDVAPVCAEARRGM